MFGNPTFANGKGAGKPDPASGDMDWICRMCRERNFSRRFDCFKCRMARPPDAELVQAPTMTAPPNGATLTGMVKSYNKKGFGFIMVFGHNAPDVFYTRENVSQRLMHPDMPGEQVTFEIFRERGKLVARNIRPIGDSTSKGAVKGMVGAREEINKSRLDEGQWRCPYCNEHNFARRLECFKCKVPKPLGAPNAGFSDAPTNIRPPQPQRKTFSPHAGARAIKESMLAERGMAAGGSGGVGGGGAGSRKSSSSSSSSRGKQKAKNRKRKRSSSSSSSSSKKKGKKKKGKKKRSKSRSSSSSSVVIEKDAAGLAKSCSGDSDIDKAKADALKELTRLQTVEPKDVRMTEFRALLREWHPDKNLHRQELATAVFQFLQKGKVLMNL